MNFFVKPSRISEEKKKLCTLPKITLVPEKALDILSNYDTDEYLYSRAVRITDSEIAGVMLWASEQKNTEYQKKALKFWKAKRSMGALKLLYCEWLNRYSEENFGNMCLKILDKEFSDKLWIIYWKKFIAASDSAGFAAAFAGIYTAENDVSFSEWKKLLLMDSESEFAGMIEILYCCYCKSEDFSFSDENLNEFINKLDDSKCELLLRNMLICFQNDNLYSVFMDRYHDSFINISRRIPESWCINLVMKITANEED